MSKEKKKSPSILFKILYYIVISFVCVLIVLLLAFIFKSQLMSKDPNYKPRLSIYTIVSPSMTPNINVYDVVVNKRPDHPDELKVGDIITFKSTSSGSEGMTITHRIVAITKTEDGKIEYMTQGDNNKAPDESLVLFNNIIGKEIITIPKLGKLQFLLSNYKILLFILLIPIGLYLLLEVFKVFDLLKLNKKVEKVVEEKSEIILKDPTEIKKQRELKEQLITKNQQKISQNDSYIKRDYEPSSLEKYQETTLKVQKNKYINEIKEETPKVETKKPIKEEKIELPTLKKNKKEIVNDEYEVLETNDLNIKLKEYDKKIKKIDKIIDDIDKIEDSKIDDKVIEFNDYLQGNKIKVIKTEETKNKKQEKIKKPTKKHKRINNEDIDIKLNGLIPEAKNVDIKELRKKELNSEKIKEENKVEKHLKKPIPKNHLNLNPKDVKKISRPNKKKIVKKIAKQPLIKIEKVVKPKKKK